MNIPKTRVAYDWTETQKLYGQWLNVVQESCSKCSVCGGNLEIDTDFNGYQLRIRCKNYKDSSHGNLGENREKRRFTHWKDGNDNLKEAIEEWNIIN